MAVQSKFKVGDKVIAVKDTPQNPEGWIGYITGITPGAFDLYAQAEGVAEEFAFDAHELELLSIGSLNLPPNVSHANIQTFREVLDKINQPKSDAVNKPKHYAVFEQLEAI